MPGLTAEVLSVWRSSEQLREELAPLDPDRHAVAALVDELHDLYQRIGSLERSNDNIRHTLEVIERAELSLDAIRERPPSGHDLSLNPARRHRR